MRTGAPELEGLTRRVRTAHGDAWQAEGRLRKTVGGGAHEVRGARLMASGLPYAKWNNADITDADFDREALLDWYAARDVPWGIRVPLDLQLELGEPLFVKRCLGLVAGLLRTFGAPDDVTMRRACPADIDAYADLELAAFGGDPEIERRWLTPALGAEGFGHWLAVRDGQPIACLSAVHTNDRAGRAAYLTGLAVTADGDFDVIARGLVSHVAADALGSGAELVHFNPGPEEATALAPLGFVEVPGFLVRVVRAD